MNKVDYYVVLECERKADHETIKMSYRRLARRWHPDQNQGDPQAEEQFKRIVEAWGVLGDPQRRLQYDRFGHASPFGAPGAYTSPGDIEILRAMARQQAEKLRNFFRRARGRDVRVTVHLSLQEAVQGVVRVVELPRGEDANFTVMKKVEIPIPASVGDGKVLRWKHQGAPGVAGGDAGDLYVVVRVSPHPIFFFDGDQLSVRVPVPRSSDAPMVSIEIPTPWGLRKVDVPDTLDNGQTSILEAVGGLLPSGARAPLHVRWVLLDAADPYFEIFSQQVSAYRARRGS